MELNLAKYKANINIVNNLLSINPEEDIEDLATRLSLSTSCPLYVIYFIIKELKPEHNDFISKRMKRLEEFYNYSNIEGETELKNEIKQRTS